MDIDEADLLKHAVAATVKARQVARTRNDWEFMGYVGAALVTELGNLYTGINVSVYCGIGFCADEIIKHGETNYAAAKAGLHCASKSLALELASRGVTVNVVAPGIIASPMADQVFSKEAIEQMAPMKRAGTPDEVPALVGFLVSDEAGYISGQVISINGAMA